MELADRVAHLALSYAAAIQQQGYRLSVAEFDAYMTKPDRRPGRPATVRQVREQPPAFRGLFEASEGLRKMMQNITGTYRSEIVDPGSPDETVVEWLSRLSWLDVGGDRITVTHLGLAMLRHLEAAKIEEEIPMGIVLDQGDELARARFFSEVAALGPCALVDRFFSIEGLLPVLQSTEISRVLTGTTDRAKLSGLEVALDNVVPVRDFAIRKSDVFHDRFVLPSDGPVWLLGTSISGLGYRLAVMVKLADEAMSAAIRAEFEREWENAEPVGQLAPPPDEDEDVPDDHDADADVDAGDVEDANGDDDAPDADQAPAANEGT